MHQIWYQNVPYAKAHKRQLIRRLFTHSGPRKHVWSAKNGRFFEKLRCRVTLCSKLSLPCRFVTISDCAIRKSIKSCYVYTSSGHQSRHSKLAGRLVVKFSLIFHVFTEILTPFSKSLTICAILFLRTLITLNTLLPVKMNELSNGAIRLSLSVAGE